MLFLEGEFFGVWSLELYELFGIGFYVFCVLGDILLEDGVVGVYGVLYRGDVL